MRSFDNFHPFSKRSFLSRQPLARVIFLGAVLLASLTLLVLTSQMATAVTEFGPQKVITSDADRANSVYAADVDGDGDIDVLSASFNDDKIAWYENTSGDGSTWTDHAITTAADGAQSVYAADVDGDGDIDALSASGLDNKIA